MLRPQKGNSGVSFNNTLLNFGLWGLTVQIEKMLFLYSALKMKENGRMFCGFTQRNKLDFLIYNHKNNRNNNNTKIKKYLFLCHHAEFQQT